MASEPRMTCIHLKNIYSIMLYVRILKKFFTDLETNNETTLSIWLVLCLHSSESMADESAEVTGHVLREEVFEERGTTQVKNLYVSVNNKRTHSGLKENNQRGRNMFSFHYQFETTS
ncbi:hypothetical protein AVEN_223299-1 [Araneus ventricosus]|uniref:Uncharacterized protein n=1 Tax=Araneus ventricosus TaxID=182803 RepID=A0A4Y2GBP4_ARAVE|nr:hypothetical protein AVEN_223299-1 [Araneus ventricosus]